VATAARRRPFGWRLATRNAPAIQAELFGGNRAEGLAPRTEPGPATCGSTPPIDLKKGNTRLQTWFKTNTGETIGAYYVYIERMLP